MASKSLFRTCSECGIEFLVPPGEDRSFADPRCPGCRRLAPAPGRLRGLVKWYNRRKGWGFITPTTGKEVFVHRSGLHSAVTTLRAGQLVEFGLHYTSRGTQAVEVVVLSEDDQP
ncbi:MAG TPA: cold shock domain-containing protein [Anaerolineae bacterium]|nr:cold shock domain-containing protein [Anaerolineae bacterium]HIQ05683.1 cold shock domain-containing protein [Anaerolineae bacterium]